jgi:transposase InsO family protein
VINPDRQQESVAQVQKVLDVSERRACRVIVQPRSTQRYDKRVPDDEQLLREQVVRLASEYGRYGYRRVAAMLRNEGWRVERIWRQEGRKVPQSNSDLSIFK